MIHLLLATLLAFGVVLRAGATEPGFAFALIGDLPYSRFERTWFADYLQRVEADEVAFIIHAGDIKSSGEPCSDEVFADRRALFDASRVPFVLVPGDNDWSDCDRMAAGRFDPLERLQALREAFFPPGESLGRKRMALISQADKADHRSYRENLRWRRGPVTFLTLNIVGPNNLRGRAARPPAEFAQRSRANLAWLAAGFAAARRDGSRAVVVTIQADPHFKKFNRGEPKAGFAEFLAALRTETLAFDGEVLLVHGDGHQHEIDQPLRTAEGRRITRFTRIETYGSPFMGWVRVSVRPGQVPLLDFESRIYAPPQSDPRLKP